MTEREHRTDVIRRLKTLLNNLPIEEGAEEYTASSIESLNKSFADYIEDKMHICDLLKLVAEAVDTTWFRLYREILRDKSTLQPPRKPPEGP